MIQWFLNLFRKKVETEETEPPICRCCKHCRYDNICYKNAYVNTDYSTGKAEQWGWEFCSSERGDGACGPKGKNFQLGRWNPMRAEEGLPQKDMGKPEKRCEDCAYHRGYPGGMIQDFTCERTRKHPKKRNPVTGEMESGSVWPCWIERRYDCGKNAKFWKPMS